MFLWRDANKAQLTKAKTVVLDAGDGAGWNLARSLLRPRTYDEDAEVAAAVARNKARKGGDDDALTEIMRKGDRPSAEEALRHPFFVVDPGEVALMVAKQHVGKVRRKGGGFFGSLFGGSADEESDGGSYGETFESDTYDEDAEVAAAVARNKARKGGDDDALTEIMRKGDRPSAEEALRHPFFVVDPGEVALMVAKQHVGKVRRKGGGFFGSLFGGSADEESDGGSYGETFESDESSTDGLTETGAENAGNNNVLADMLGLEKRISKQQNLIMQQSTTIMRMRQTNAPQVEIEAEQKTLEKMKVGLQGLLRSFSFSQIEARTEIVKAATEMQAVAKEAGVVRVSQPQVPPPRLPILVPEGTTTSALTVCPYIAI